MKNILVGMMILVLVAMLTACGDESAPVQHELGDEGLVEEIITEEIQVEEILVEEILVNEI